jgi:predicted nucleic-acid-binding Zn-ribbon protein
MAKNMSDATTIEINGKPLHCLICENENFFTRQAQLNTATATFFKFDWANASGTCYVCAECGYIHWFLPQESN